MTEYTLAKKIEVRLRQASLPVEYKAKDGAEFDPSKPIEWSALQDEAKFLKVHHTYELDIDGLRFPFYLSEDGVSVMGLNRYNIPAITITIPCEELIVIDDRFKDSE